MGCSLQPASPVITLLKITRDRNLLFLYLIIATAGNAQVNPFGVSDAGLDYLTGQALFEKTWVSAPASTQASDGLGPLYNARSCAQCHIEAGKGKLPDALTIRLNDPYFGRQIQTRAISGLAAEAQIEVNYSARLERLADSTEVLLHEPHYAFSGQPELMKFSARLAPSLAGLGLLETIPAEEIAAKADPEDHDNDGISGRVGSGRFGWKADINDLEQQTGLALSLDLGISSELFPASAGDCTMLQEYCLASLEGDSGQGEGPEISGPAFASLLNFVRNIPRPVDKESVRKDTVENVVEAGEAIFKNIGCLNCHQTGYIQGTISPYSDLLLHDMGEALADSLDEDLSREWRTPPLWGLSVYSLREGQFYLHDGRANSLPEAILWHGGEAENSKQAFMALSAKERDDLINFLQSI